MLCAQPVSRLSGQSLTFEPWLAVQLDDHYVPPAIVLPATPTMATRAEASWVISLTVQLIAHTAGRLSMPGRCRHLRVLPSREAGEAPESEASRRLCLHYSCQIGRHWQCFRRTLLLTLWLWLVQEEKIKAADDKYSAVSFARCELSDAAHAPGSSAMASSDSWSNYRAAKIAADERCRCAQLWHVSCWLSTLAWAGTVSRQAAR